jgi:hypothetical protein
MKWLECNLGLPGPAAIPPDFASMVPIEVSLLLADENHSRMGRRNCEFMRATPRRRDGHCQTRSMDAAVIGTAMTK